MTGTIKIVLISMSVALLGAGIALSMWGIPAPAAEVKKSLHIKDLNKAS
ncbi:MAG: hypothetical protein H2057_04865 [Alphaproteobacteria bacterium]|nr:hypothetical protein [Alphaproteobacteria bacterium]